MSAQRQIDQIEGEIVDALAAKRLPRFRYPTQPADAITLWRELVQQLMVSSDAFVDHFAQRIAAANRDRLRLMRDDAPPFRFRGMEGHYLKLVDRSGTTVFQFFFGDYSPMFREYSR